MDSMFVLFDMLLLGLGVYLLYAWYLLKFKGEVKENILLVKEYPFKKCKDKNGYFAYTAPRLFVFALICSVAGAIGLANDYQNFLGGYYMVVSGIFLAAVVWFAFAVKKGYKRFW